MNRRGTVGYYSNAINATLHEILLEIFSQMSLFGVDKTCKIERLHQRYTYRVLQTIQMKFILLCVWAERVIFGSAKTALKFKYEISIG